MRGSIAAALILAFLAAALSVLAWPQLPDPAPLHFDASGQADGFGSPWVVAALVPVLQLLLPLLILGITRLDPRKENVAASAGGIDLILMALGAYLLLVHMMLLQAAVTGGHLSTRGMLAGLGALFMAIGAALPRLKSNYFAGIRTPWALQSEAVWDKTHRLGGWAMGASGLLTLLAALVLPPVAGFVVGLGALMLGSMVAVPASYLFWKQEREGRA